jgi:hypothetical protein
MPTSPGWPPTPSIRSCSTPARWRPSSTVGGELNKLAANVALGRDTAGVHWRSDGVEGLNLGEGVAV